MKNQSDRRYKADHGASMTQKVRRTIAVYEMATFVAVLINVGAVFAMAPSAIPPIMWVAVAVALALSFASLIAGILLWRDRPAARQLSIVVQALQVPRIAIEGIVNYAVGLALSLVVGVGTAPSTMRQPVHLAITFGGEAEGFYLGINVLALAALVLVARWRQAGVAAAEPLSRQPNERCSRQAHFSDAASPQWW
jgi:hypothetical protein